ncbi:serine hydrolase domain-containing protein [Novosphingobium sp. Gsoil 351]|uniref:serine hydrolase domain-containing protein n=1 Tax=Novosphingobium sp. Gsoil 351 TaxID=2675225 RepID=UPI00351BBFC2
MAQVRAFLIVVLALVPALNGCTPATAPTPPPLSEAALAAVVAKPGVPREALARRIDDLFTPLAEDETRAVIVVQGGQTVAERYAPGYHENTRFISWSMAKTITAVMIGMLIADGRLQLDQPAPVPAWQRPGDPRGEITLRQLLQMRSGLHHTEAGNPIYESGEVRMLFLDGRDDMAAYAEAQPLEAEPGRHWEYSSNTTVILADIATRALTAGTDPVLRRRAMADYLRNRLFEPAGMTSALPEFDRSGTLIGGSLIHATARDWAKFGEFLRNGGAVKGVQLVPRAWIEFMTTPNPRNPGYGAQTWLNRPQAANGERGGSPNSRAHPPASSPHRVTSANTW